MNLPFRYTDTGDDTLTVDRLGSRVGIAVRDGITGEGHGVLVPAHETERVVLALREAAHTPPRSHMCTGTDCHICGEPPELREIRHDIADALFDVLPQGRTSADCQRLARAVTEKIRPALLHWILNQADNQESTS